jgi:molecular chaperone DnaK (HSP70)
VDRTSAILPVNAPEGVPKISPVEASRLYLAHLRDSWNEKHPAEPFDSHQVLVTVPASFDAVARELTLSAAQQAGYRDVILLEEPQAAFYAWIERNPNWRDLVGVGDLILVIDIGGGTTDFTLIAVKDREGEIALERVAVGDHILLGGDNIDAALAHHAAQSMGKLDAIQFHALWQHCRTAKEKLLAEGSTEKEETVTVLGRGTGVVGGSKKTKLKRTDIDTILLDGFLPVVGIDEAPEGRRAALTELGLPFAADAAITRHMAHFLHRQASAPTAFCARPWCGIAFRRSWTGGSGARWSRWSRATSCTPSRAGPLIMGSHGRGRACVSGVACRAAITSGSKRRCPQCQGCGLP